MADGKVTISTALDNTGFKRGVNQVSGSLGGLRSVAGKLAAALAAAFAVQKVIQFGAACIQLGSDVAEVQNVVDVSFGGMAYKMEEFADTAITSFGMSELAAKKTGGTFMAMAKGMGVADQAASDMAIALTGLSGDAASFFNKSQEEVAVKLASVFTGETESLKELGVVMTQANLQQYAMANGMNSNIQAMSQAEQVALRYSFVMDSLKLAQGDFLRTQDSWANQTRILSMQWQQFMSIIGQALTTVLLPVVKMLNTIVAALINMANAFNAVITSIFGGAQKQIQATGAAIEGANAGIASSAGAAAAGEQELADGTKAAAKAARTATASIDELNVLQQDTGSAGSGGSPSGGGAGGSGAVGGGLTETTTEVQPLTEKMQQIVDKIQKLFEPLKKIDFDNLISALKKLKDAAEPIGKTVFSGLEWAWYNLFVPLAAWTIEDALPVFLEVLASALDVLNAAIEALKPLFGWLWENFLKPIATWTGGTVIAALGLLRDGLQGVSQWITDNQGAFQIMTGIVGAFFALWKGTEIATWLINAGGIVGVFNSIRTAVSGATIAKLADKAVDLQIIALYAADFVKAGATMLLTIMQNTAAWVASTAAKVADTAAQWAQIAAVTAWNAVCALATAATTAFGAAIAFLTSPIGLVVAAVVALVALIAVKGDEIQEILKKVDDFLQNVFVTDWTNIFGPVLGSVLNAFMKNVENIWNAVKRILNGVIDFVRGVFTGDWERAWMGVQNIFGGIFDGMIALAKAPINAIIGLLNAAIGAINGMIDGINQLSFDVPSWVPLLGGKSWGFDLPHIPQIPHLAQGAVLPANQPFLAVVGDQRRGTNVEAPLETITQAVIAALSQLGGAQELTASQPIEVKLDGQVLYRAMAKIEANRGAKIGGAFANAY